jgi:hypothetical protein
LKERNRALFVKSFECVSAKFNCIWELFMF